jgi:hydrogenase nickel incorporation protein HypA/HybF
MHEISLAEEILHIIEDTAQRESFTQVKAIWLEIGQLSCVETESLCFCLNSIINKHGITQYAQLKIIEIPGHGWCHTCRSKVPLTTLYDTCPQCGSYGLKVTDGNTVRIKELEVE